MAAPRKYPDELRERATRMAVELRADPATKPGAIARVAEQFGMHPETLRNWVRQAEIDGYKADRPARRNRGDDGRKVPGFDQVGSTEISRKKRGQAFAAKRMAIRNQNLTCFFRHGFAPHGYLPRHAPTNILPLDLFPPPRPVQEGFSPIMKRFGQS